MDFSPRFFPDCGKNSLLAPKYWDGLSGGEEDFHATLTFSHVEQQQQPARALQHQMVARWFPIQRDFRLYGTQRNVSCTGPNVGRYNCLEGPLDVIVR